jgi:hypothetical protein
MHLDRWSGFQVALFWGMLGTAVAVMAAILMVVASFLIHMRIGWTPWLVMAFPLATVAAVIGFVISWKWAEIKQRPSS